MSYFKRASLDDVRFKPHDVFVSYRHLDAEIRDILVEAFTENGLTVWWDAKLVSEEWRPQLAQRINHCRLVVTVWSQQVATAPEEVADEMAQARGLRRLLVLRTDDAAIPKRFSDQNFLAFNQWRDPAKQKPQLDVIVAEVRRRVEAKPIYKIVPTEDAITTLVAEPEFGDIPGAPKALIGRGFELDILRDAWASTTPKKTNAVVLHALGGAGKSALLGTFANELLAAGGGGAQRIYGWSAYSQGSGEQKRTDADSFISKALGDLGFVGHPPRDPIERARELAKLIQRERVLLLLDGLEPLQDPPGINKGRFKDKGLAELVKILAKLNPGLMLLTTRQPVPELDGHGPLVIDHPLDELSPMAGAELLVDLGVHGRQRDLETAVADVKGHALTVTLLGSYLAEVCGGDIRHRDQFDFANIVLTKAEEEALATDKTIVPAKRAEKVMRGYLEQFDKLASDGASAGRGGPERVLLSLLGLFDRPADGPAVEKLLAQRIPGLTDELFVETEKTITGPWWWKSTRVESRELNVGERAQRLRRAKERLRKLKLLAGANPRDPQELEAHPIVRAFFAARLIETAPEAAKSAHDILYRHYVVAAPDLPDTLEAMQPLFHAVQHGIKAGRANEVFSNILKRRIRRGYRQYLIYQIGAYGSDLAVLAHFFEELWGRPIASLQSADRAWLLVAAANDLKAVGRLTSSAEALSRAVEANRALERKGHVVGLLGKYGEAQVMIGEVAHAIATAQQALAEADNNNDIVNKAHTKADLAILFFLSGQEVEARKLFAEARTLKGSPMPQPREYWFGELLLHEGKSAAAAELANAQLRFANTTKGRKLGAISLGFAWLSIGSVKVHLQADATDELNAAVEMMRKGGQNQFLPLALLARAAHRRKRAAAGEAEIISKIREDLDEAEDIAGDEMRLYVADIALERARFALDLATTFDNPAAARAEAQEQTEIAGRLIARTGYRRREGELTDLKRLIASG